MGLTPHAFYRSRLENGPLLSLLPTRNIVWACFSSINAHLEKKRYILQVDVDITEFWIPHWEVFLDQINTDPLTPTPLASSLRIVALPAGMCHCSQ